MYKRQNNTFVAQIVQCTSCNQRRKVKDFFIKFKKKSHFADFLTEQTLDFVLHRLFGGLAEMDTDDIGSVSYTHLDVYKRQDVQRLRENLPVAGCLSQKVDKIRVFKNVLHLAGRKKILDVLRDSPRSMMTGLIKPNSRSEERSLLICSGEWVRALFT